MLNILIFGEMFVLLIYISVAVCWLCAVSYLIFICFYLLFFNYSTYVFIIPFICFLFFCFLFHVLCVF